MGMMDQLRAKQGTPTQNGYQSGGTASFPITGFPQSAYLGNNRRYVGGGDQTRVGGVSSFGQNSNLYNPKHMLITAVVLIVLGVWLWHLDNK